LATAFLKLEAEENTRPAAERGDLLLQNSQRMYVGLGYGRNGQRISGIFRSINGCPQELRALRELGAIVPCATRHQIAAEQLL